MKKILLSSLISLFSVVSIHGQQNEYPFRDPKLSTNERIDNLINLLTVDEKIGMMMDESKPIPRLKIPAYGWWNEALHGVARAGLATVFPQAIGMAATWDDAEHLKTFEIISDEARAKFNETFRKEGLTGRYQGLSFWTPNINIFRDPRWGRGQETYGEDPFLTTKFGLAAVEGLQGNDSKYFKTHACAKHFAVHSGPEWNRHSYNADVSGRDLWETYLPAFKALVQQGNVREVMCAYNAFKGQPCCGNSYLITDILRNRWGYNGIVVSDCWALSDFVPKDRHGTHPNSETAAADAVLHTTNLECGNLYENLKKSLEKGLITEKELNESLKKVLKGWFELGMFDPVDMNPWSKIPLSAVDSPEHKLQAIKVAQKSMTLLKNENNILPLSKNLKKIAVIGPNADNEVMQWGNYNGTPSETITILKGIQKKLPNTEIIYDKGCDLVEPWVRTSQFNNFVINNNGEKGLKVEFFNNNEFKGKPVATVINSSGISYNTFGGTALAPNVGRENVSIRITGIYKASYSGEVVFSAYASDEYQILIDGKKVFEADRKIARFPAEYIAKFEKGKEYKFEFNLVQKGKNVSLVFETFKKDRINFANILTKIKDVDAIVFAGGLSPSLEGEEMLVNAEGFKGGDKVSIDLPKIQRELLAELKKTGKPVIFVLSTGSSLALEQDEKNYDALLCSWYSGQAGGIAVSDVIFGDYNPAGRLPITFYKSLEQLDKGLTQHDDISRQGFENYDMQGRTYRYLKDRPLYAFGQGLSYSKFKYGDAIIEQESIKSTEGFTVNIPISNISERDGEEVVQVYIKRNDDVSAPIKSLKAFKRLEIKAGQTENIKLNIGSDAFEFYDEKADGLIPKSGSYTVLYGGTSEDEHLKKIFITVK